MATPSAFIGPVVSDPTLTRGPTTSTHYIDILKQKIQLLDAVELADITARPPLVTAVETTQAAADTARAGLDADAITNPVTVPLGSLDAGNLNQLIAEIKNATSYAQAMAALDGFVARFGTTRAISGDVLAAITALKTNPVGAFATTLTTAGAPPTAASTFDEQLKPKLLEVANLIPPVLENLTASDALKAQAKVHQDAVDAVKNAAIDAHLEVTLVRHDPASVQEARKRFDDSAALRNQWNIIADPANFDLNLSPAPGTLPIEEGVKNLFGTPDAVKISGQNITYTSPDGLRSVEIQQKGMALHGDMSVDELKAALQFAYKQWGKDGLKISQLKDKDFGVRIALACDLLAQETGDKNYTKYKMVMPWDWRNPLYLPWKGAEMQVGAKKIGDTARFKRSYEAQTDWAKYSKDVGNITVELLRSEDVLTGEWEPLFIKCFPDGDDRESREQLLERLKNEPNTFFFLVRDANGKPLGMELGQLLITPGNPAQSGAVYIPYSATRDGDRNKGVNPAVAKVTDEIYKKAGATHFLIDVEDKRVFANDVYKDDIDTLKTQLIAANPGMAAAVAEAAATAHVEKTVIDARQNYWRRQGYMMTDDAQLPYIRPASSDLLDASGNVVTPAKDRIQAYDTLIFRVLDETNAKWTSKPLYNPATGRTEISMQAYKDFYLEINRAQYGNLSEADLRREYAAIDKFLGDWDKLVAGIDPVTGAPIPAKQWVKLNTTPVRSKDLTAKPDAVKTVIEIKSPADSKKPEFIVQTGPSISAVP